MRLASGVTIVGKDTFFQEFSNENEFRKPNFARGWVSFLIYVSYIKGTVSVGSGFSVGFLVHCIGRGFNVLSKWRWRRHWE